MGGVSAVGVKAKAFWRKGGDVSESETNLKKLEEKLVR